MKVELLNITDDALNFIGKCASICYDSDTSSVEKNVKRAVHCANAGHLATLRFAHATFKVSNISRICSHQFVRSKHLDFLQRSQRYCKEEKAQMINPIFGEMYCEVFEECYKRALENYNWLISHGIKKEDARFVLPQGTTTELIVTGNLQAWMDFINLRATKEAQWEIREVAIEINNQLAQKLPELFKEMK